MKLVTSKSLVRTLAAVSFVVSLYASPNAIASEHETECMNHVQNKISWNYDGRKQWETTNVEKLCKGTTNPKEPGECFNKVMQGQVKWGSDDKWEWKNAVSLCSGADNSDERISCFKARIDAGDNWNTAILDCQISGKVGLKNKM